MKSVLWDRSARLALDIFPMLHSCIPGCKPSPSSIVLHAVVLDNTFLRLALHNHKRALPHGLSQREVVAVRAAHSIHYNDLRLRRAASDRSTAAAMILDRVVKHLQIAGNAMALMSQKWSREQKFRPLKLQSEVDTWNAVRAVSTCTLPAQGEKVH